ncbi:MAG TPA: carboxypeptidase-like regulatory domain-containing protein [Chitinivibrionales bacterium]|nr:carboxypeptidase-like regulatory domain-containing protein [Chitinivibrionales bacterium]
MSGLFPGRIACLLLACCAFLFVGCGSAPTMAAGSSVSGNAKVAGVVLDAGGNAASNVSVQLRTVAVTGKGDSSRVLKAVRTGSDGSYSFDSVKAGKYAVFCRDSAAGSSAIQQKILLVNDSSSAVADLALTPDVVVRGRIVAANAADQKSLIVAVPGMGRTFIPDTIGNYTLTSVPRTAIDVAFIHGSTVDFLTLPPLTGAGDTSYINDVQFAQTTAGTQGVDSFYEGSLSGSFTVVPVEKQDNALLFEDFENPLSGGVTHNEIYTLIPAPGGTGDGRWVVRPNADGNTVTPAVFPTGFDSCMVTAGAFRGKSLRIFITLQNAGSPPTGGIGVDICVPEVYYDLSKMTEFSFYAKGSGRLRVVFHTDTVGSGSGEGEFIYEFTIPTEWQRISMKSADLAARPGSQTAARGVTWQGASRGVTSISFFALTNDTLYMDDMYMFGIAASDIVVTSPGNTMP